MGKNCKTQCPYCKQVITQIYFCSHLLGKCKEAFLKNEKENIKKYTNPYKNYYEFIYNKDSIMNLNFGTKVAHRNKKEDYGAKNGSLHREAVKKLLEEGKEESKEEDPSGHALVEVLKEPTDENGFTKRDRAFLTIINNILVSYNKQAQNLERIKEELYRLQNKDSDSDYSEEESEPFEPITQLSAFTTATIRKEFPDIDDIEREYLPFYMKFKP